MKFFATILLFGLLVITASAQTVKPKTTAVRPTSTPVKKLNEQAEWDKVSSITDKVGRVAALKQFIAAFPKSDRLGEATQSIVTTQTELGNERIAAADVAAAAEFFTAAAKDAPKPVPDQLFTDTLAKFPANLYFRGARAQAIEIAKVLEDKADTKVGQLLSIATFYISIESGGEAKRVAEMAVKLDANSSAAHQMLGLANRLEFQLDESAASYARAVEIEPDSIAARRGLAEMKRSLGKGDEAAAIYREILAKDEANVPARTGLILSLFEAGKRTEAEAEMAKSAEADAGNTMLLAGVAYWYAAHDEGEKAVSFAKKAIAADPRFIWSHIALARGYLGLKNPVDAERTLLAARRYGNFPTLEYELASARLAGGYYREAAEELTRSFSVKDGVIRADLGGRVARESKYFTELVGFERRASIFAPTAADSPENAAKLMALLAFKQELDQSEPNAENAARSADDFVKGDDKMKVHRQIFAAAQLLEKRTALAKVAEMAQAATANIDAGLDIPNPAVAVMASELYENRKIAAAAGKYIDVPDVARTVLSAILRGQIEEINGWAAYQANDAATAVTRLKRAVIIFPPDSVWWRSSTWRLGAALALSGKEADALEMYIKSYKSSTPTALRYNFIEALYKKVHGNTDELEAKIGPNPAPPPQPVAQKTETVQTPPVVEPTPQVTTEPVTVTNAPDVIPAVVPGASPTPTPTPTPEPEKSRKTPKELFRPVVINIPSQETAKTVQKETSEKSVPSSTPPVETKSVEDTRPTPTQTPTPVETKPVDDAKPVLTPEADRPRTVEGQQDVKPCTLNVSEETVTVQSGGGDLAVIVGLEDDGDLEGITATSSSSADVSVRREMIAGVKARALFVIRSASAKIGVFQVTLELPCGKKNIVVKVR